MYDQKSRLQVRGSESARTGPKKVLRAWSPGPKKVLGVWPWHSLGPDKVLGAHHLTHHGQFA